MKTRPCIQTLVAILFFLALGAAHSFAAEPGASDSAVSSDHGPNWTCTYQTLKPEPEYYRGRAGQLEHSTRWSQQKDRGQMICKQATGDQVKVVGPCPSH